MHNSAAPVRTFTITVPKPLITNSPLSQRICSGTNTTAVTLTSNTTGATLQWSVKSVTGVTGQTVLNGTGTIPVQTLYATGSGTGSIIYTITAIANGCQGPSVEYAIDVIPLPTQAKTYGDPTKRYNINAPAPLKGNTAIIGTGRWSQSSGPNTVIIKDPSNPDTEISGHIPGSYEFNWTISNNICVSEKALTLAVNAPPIAGNDSFDERIGISVNGNVSTNDRDPDGTVLTFTKLTDPSRGSITEFNADGSFIYVPEPNFMGTETFTYEACDVDGACVTATVSLSFYPSTIVNLTPLKSEVFEGGKVRITAELESPIHEDVTITLAYGGDITNGDYSLSGNLTLTIKAGQTKTSEQVQILAVRDGIKEIDETLLVTVNTLSSKYVDKGTGSEVIIHDVFPTNNPPSGKDENADIRPDPMTSPNEDGVGNDEFFIYNISAYPDNEVVIFNRWGNEVFRMKNYDNYDKAFRGKANTGVLTNTRQDLVDGVYYYLIYTKTPGNVTKLNKGYFILKRKK